MRLWSTSLTLLCNEEDPYRYSGLINLQLPRKSATFCGIASLWTCHSRNEAGRPDTWSTFCRVGDSCNPRVRWARALMANIDPFKAKYHLLSMERWMVNEMHAGCIFARSVRAFVLKCWIEHTEMICVLLEAEVTYTRYVSLSILDVGKWILSGVRDEGYHKIHSLSASIRVLECDCSSSSSTHWV